MTDRTSNQRIPSRGAGLNVQNAYQYDESRAEMLEFIPGSAHRILDVGCASGRFARELLESRDGLEIWGIDPVDASGGDAGYHRRLTGSFPEDVPDDAGQFDCVVFNDVLEHLVDPWAAVAQARALLTPAGSVVASIPNIRNVARVVRPLLMHGKWEYGDYGILDRTHLRFFTRSSIVELMEEGGFTVECIEPIRKPTRGRWAMANRLARGRLEDLVAERFAVVALRASRRPAGSRS